MRYLFTNEILDAVLSATNGDSNYPVANLQDRFLQKRFQSTGEISQITSLLNAVADVNCLAHGHTNATSIYSYLYGQGQFIGQAYTNLVQDPNDLRASGANWTASNSTDELTEIEINGHKFTKIINSGIQGYNYQTFIPSFTNLILTGQFTVKKGDTTDNRTLIHVRNLAIGAHIFDFAMDFDNYPASPQFTLNKGTLLDYEWIDAETVKINFQCDALNALTDNVEIRCYGSIGAINAEYTYWTEVQLIDSSSITMFPFIEGTHSADVINETFLMPNKFAIRLKINPKFAYDTGILQRFCGWEIDSSNLLIIYYIISGETPDTIIVGWKNGTNFSVLVSQRFGSGFTELNQELDIILFLNLVSGGQNDSILIVIPQESGSINTDNSWSLPPDIKGQDFSVLSIGNALGINQADSDYESLRIYEWDGVKPTITSSADADAYFSGKTPSFEFEPDSVLFKESVQHNLNSDTDMTYFDKLALKQIVTTIEGPDPVYLGGLAAGEYYQMPDPEEAFPLPLLDNSHVEQSPSGQVLSNYEKPLQAPEWTFKGVLNDIANKIRSEYIEIGKGTPFYADFFENNRDFYSPMYCFFLEEPGDAKNSRKRDYSVKLLEAR